MTELRKQDIQGYTDQAIARRRYRDDEISCEAIRKDPDGGLICTQRGMAVATPKIWYGHEAKSLVLTSAFQEVTIDSEDFTNDLDDTVYVLAANQLEILKIGDIKLDVKVLVRTTDTGRWAFEIVIDEDIGAGFVEQGVTTVAGGRGTFGVVGEVAALNLLLLSVRQETSNYDILFADDVILCDASGGAFVVNLPSPIIGGKVYYIKKIDSSANAVTVNLDVTGDTIDDDLSRDLESQYDSVSVVSDGLEWWII